MTDGRSAKRIKGKVEDDGTVVFSNGWKRNADGAWFRQGTDTKCWWATSVAYVPAGVLRCLIDMLERGEVGIKFPAAEGR